MYILDQVDHIIEAQGHSNHPEFNFFVIKIQTGDNEYQTNHLNITEDEMQQFRAILAKRKE